MTFRISTGSAYLQFRSLLNVQNAKMLSAQEQMSTGKKINRPSDDPESAKSIAGFRNSLSRIETYLRNVSNAEQRWTHIENGISGINDIYVKAREIAIAGSNGTQSAETRELMAAEIHQLSETLLGIGNTKINGEYIFAGYKTDTQPFAFDGNHPNATPAAVYSGDSNIKRIEISEGQTFDIQINAGQFFTNSSNDPDEVDLFQVLADLEQALLTNNIDETDSGSVQSQLDNITIALDSIQGQWAAVGAKTNRLTTTRDNLEGQHVIFTDFISQKEDVDLAEVAFEFERARVALQATVSSAGAVLNQPSLIQFIGR